MGTDFLKILFEINNPHYTIYPMDMWKVLLFAVVCYPYWVSMTSTSLYADTENDLKNLINNLENKINTRTQAITQTEYKIEQIKAEIAEQQKCLNLLYQEQAQVKIALESNKQEYNNLIQERLAQERVNKLAQEQVNKNAQIINDVDRLENEITELKKMFSAKYKDKKLHQLEMADWTDLINLASAMCKQMDIFSSFAGGVNMKNVLENKAYLAQVGNTSTNKNFQQLIEDIVKKFCESSSDDDTEVNKKLRDSFKKINNFANDINILSILNRLNNNLHSLDHDIRRKLLTLLLEYTDACSDRLISGLQVVDVVAISYKPCNTNMSLEGKTIPALVHMYKQLILSQCIINANRAESIEGLVYLTKYMSPIVFPGIKMPNYLYSEIGTSYTEDFGDPIKNLHKVLNRINDKERLVDFIWAGVYDGVAIGEEIFGKIVLKDDTEYQSLLAQEKDAAKAINYDEEYNDLLEKADKSKNKDYSKFEAYRENFIKDKAEAVINYKRNKAEELARQCGYIY